MPKFIWRILLPTLLFCLMISIIFSAISFHGQHQSKRTHLERQVQSVVTWMRQFSSLNQLSALDVAEILVGLDVVIIDHKSEEFQQYSSSNLSLPISFQLNAIERGAGDVQLEINGNATRVQWQPLWDRGTLFWLTPREPFLVEWFSIWKQWVTLSIIVGLFFAVALWHWVNIRVTDIKYRQIFNRLAIGDAYGSSALIDHRGHILFAQPGFIRVTGFHVNQRLHSWSLYPQVSSAISRPESLTPDHEIPLPSTDGEVAKSLSITPCDRGHYFVLRIKDRTEGKLDQQLLGPVIDEMPHLILVCHPDGQIIAHNHFFDECCKLLSFSCDSIDDWCKQSGCQELSQTWHSLVSLDVHRGSCRQHLTLPNGQQKTLRWKLSFLGSETDESIRSESGSWDASTLNKIDDIHAVSSETAKCFIVASASEITEEVLLQKSNTHAQAEITRLTDTVEAMHRSRTLFLASLNHEIRTPMSSIVGAAELLLDSTLSDDTRQYVDMIHGSANSLLSVVNDVLDLARMETSQVEVENIDFNLSQLLNDIYQLYHEPVKRKGLSFVYFYDSGLPTLWRGDPKRIRQVINNLLANAIKYTDSGHVELFVKAEEVTSAKYRVNITVSDTGCGIREERLKQLLMTENKHSAMPTLNLMGNREYLVEGGVGLSISRHLANALGGEISATSVLGQGSQFTLSVPMCIGRQPKISNQQDDYRRRSKHATRRILVAEDNQINQKIVEQMLIHLGMQCTLVADGQEAVNAVNEQSFDCVLMDLSMPTMDGYRATELIRSMEGVRSSIPIIALTANVMREDQKRCAAAGMNGFISKPLHIENLRRTIERAIISHVSQRLPISL